MVVNTKNELMAWGGNRFGQVGNGSVVDARSPVPIMKGSAKSSSVPSFPASKEEQEDEPQPLVVKSIAAGRCCSLAVGFDGELYAWGNNDDCLLGTGVRLKQEVPKRILEKGVRAVAAGWRHCLALTEVGEVLAWGGNDYGQLGDGSKTSQRKPVKVPIDGPVKAISAAWYHSLALTESGDVLTWGFNSQSNSGNQCTLAPSIVLRSGITAIAAGGTHNLALTEQGTVLAWGGNDHGQLGDGSNTRRIEPVTVATNVIMLAAGGKHSVVLDQNYCVVHWGHWTRVDGSQVNVLRPMQVNVEGGAFAIAAGDAHSLAVSQAGEVYCWGGNSFGQLGSGTMQDREEPFCTLPPATVETVPWSVIQEQKLKGSGMADLHASSPDDSLPKKRAPRSNRVVGTPGIAQQSGGFREIVIKTAHTGGDVLAIVPNGEKLAILQVMGKHVKVRWQELEGWTKAGDVQREVPQLLHKIEGTYVEPPKVAAQYPLSYDGCASSPSSFSRTASRTFLPGTGFRPSSHHATGAPTMASLTWHDGPPWATMRKKRTLPPASLTWAGGFSLHQDAPKHPQPLALVDRARSSPDLHSQVEQRRALPPPQTQFRLTF